MASRAISITASTDPSRAAWRGAYTAGSTQTAPSAAPSVDHLADGPLQILGRPDDIAGGQVHPGEGAEAAEATDGRHLHPVAGRQLGEGPRPHGALEVDVEMGLREGDEVRTRRP